MATYRGGEIPIPPQPETDLEVAGPPLPGMENVEEELSLPEQVGSDYLRRPGQKGYMDTKPGAKFGSSTVVTPKDKFNAQQVPQAEAHDAGSQAQPGFRQEGWDPPAGR